MARKTNQSTLMPILKRRRWGTREAEVVLSAWRASGLSLSAFARRQGIDAWRLMRWRRRLAQGGVLQFHRVKVIPEPRNEAAGGDLELVLSNGRRVTIRQGFDAELLEELVRAVESWPC